jgi:hypothetical protein
MEDSKIKLTPLLDTLYLGKLEDAIYFSPKYANYISNSRLGLLKKDGPDAFLAGFADQGFKSCFALGSYIHELTLQPDLFELGPNLEKPTAKMGAMADHLYSCYLNNHVVTDKDIYEASDAVHYYKDKMNEDKCDQVRGACIQYWKNRQAFEQSYQTTKTIEYTDPKSMELVNGCINALANDSRIQELLHPTDSFGEYIISENEQAILLDIQVDIEGRNPHIIHLKAKLDNYTIDKETNTITINDVKTSSQDTRDFANSIEAFSYYRELSWYAMLLSLYAAREYGMLNPIIKGNFLVVSTKEPYYTAVYPMNPTLFKRGIEEYKHLLKQASLLI